MATGTSGARRWLSTLPILLVLLAVLLQWTGSQLQSRVISLGSHLWEGYGAELRLEPTQPAPPTPPAQEEEAGEDVDTDLLNDLLGEDTTEGATDEAAVDEDLLNDLLGGVEEEEEAPSEAVSPPEVQVHGDPSEGDVDHDLLNALLADADEAPDEGEEGAGEDHTDDNADENSVDTDLLGSLLGEEIVPEVDEEQARYERELARFETAQARYEDIQARRTTNVRRFAAMDLALGNAVDWINGHIQHLFVLLVGLAGITATWTRHHIALRNAQGPVDDRLSNALQLLGNGLMAASLSAQAKANLSSGFEVDHPELLYLWLTTFVGMMLGNLYHLVKPLQGPRVGLGAATLTVPLYTAMALLAGLWFFALEGYPQGPAVYLDKLSEHSGLYLQVGLYVWAGMLLKRTELAHRSFDLLRPWKLPPELLAVVVVVASAIPTAYSGASGIFVIAVGAILYQELRAAGARNSLALASSAMSGSLGVVLAPCLLVVIVAYLNPVSSEELFGLGRWVFLLTASLFAVGVVLTKRGPWRFQPADDAKAVTLQALKPVALYGLVFVGVLAAFYVAFEVKLDQLSAPMILPVALMLMLVLDRRLQRSDGREVQRVAPRIEDATGEASLHIGALLLLMGMSVVLGGLVERGELMSVVPDDLGSPWAAMAVLVAILVVVGMTMDPYGAVILVSATLAGVAEKNGISPVHFWMVVLVAFELGYLTPPVALNHLLVRQVVDEVDDPGPDDPPPETFWQRHERILLPVAVMGTALLLVAFVPLALGWG